MAMALEVKLPPPLIDFEFNTGRESPSVDTRPSTPKRFGEVYFSAPSSPARGFGVNAGYAGFDGELSFSNYERGDVSTSSSPLCWDRSSWFFPSPNRAIDRIKTMESVRSPFLSPETPSSNNSRRKKSFWSSFSPKRRKEVKSNPFQVLDKGEAKTEEVRGRGRGRERESDVPASRSGRRATRSLSPLRVSKYPWEEQQEEERGAQNTNQSSSVTKPPLSAKGSRKWSLKDFLLFRSASEGHKSEKDPFRKYAEMYRKQQAMKSSGVKSADGSPTVPAPRKGQISAHELHYTVNKAISQDMKKKTFLPYKQGILGRLAVNPAVHALAYGHGSLPNTYG